MELFTQRFKHCMPLANAIITVSASEGFPPTSSPSPHLEPASPSRTYNTNIGNFQFPQLTGSFCVTTALKHPLDQGHLLLLEPPEDKLSGERMPVGVPAFARRTSTVSRWRWRKRCRTLHGSTTAHESRICHIDRFHTWHVESEQGVGERGA